MKFGGQPTPWSDEQIDGLRCRTVAQTLIEEIGADGPESAEDAAKRAVAVIQRQRDRIAALEAEKADYEREKLKREAQEPVAFRWLGPGKGWRAVYAEPPVSRELEARIRELEAEKAERERELAAVKSVLHDEMCMKPLYAHQLALREPTEEECSRIYAIADMNPITRGPEIGEMPVRAGRAMWQAVREVMTK